MTVRSSSCRWIWTAVGCAVSMTICVPRWVVADKHAPSPPVVCPCPAFFRDLPPLGAETPRALAEQLLRGLASADRRQVVACFDCGSAESLGTAYLFAGVAEVAGRQRKLASAVRERFGQAGVDAVRGDLGIDLQEPGELLPPDKVKALLGRVEWVTEKDTTVARFPEPLGNGGWLHMHRTEGRWYVSPPETDALRTLFSAAALEQMTKLVRSAQTAMEGSSSLKEFRGKLAALRKEHKLAPGQIVGASSDVEPPGDKPAPKDRPKGEAAALPIKHFRAEVRNRLDTSLAGAVLLDLTIETPEPADISLMLTSKGTEGGGVYKT